MTKHRTREQEDAYWAQRELEENQAREALQDRRALGFYARVEAAESFDQLKDVVLEMADALDQLKDKS